MGVGGPRDGPAEMRRPWEAEVRGVSPGHRYIGTLTFPSKLAFTPLAESVFFTFIKL